MQKIGFPYISPIVKTVSNDTKLDWRLEAPEDKDNKLHLSLPQGITKQWPLRSMLPDTQANARIDKNIKVFILVELNIHILVSNIIAFVA